MRGKKVHNYNNEVSLHCVFTVVYLVPRIPANTVVLPVLHSHNRAIGKKHSPLRNRCTNWNIASKQCGIVLGTIFVLRRAKFCRIVVLLQLCSYYKAGKAS